MGLGVLQGVSYGAVIDAADGFDRHGPYWREERVTQAALVMLAGGTYFGKRGRKVSKELEAAEQQVDEYTERLTGSIKKLVAAEDALVGKTRVVSGKVRDATQKLADGLARIEKCADFDRLERYVELLERAEKAIAGLAVLEQSGRLGKIAAAIR